MTRVLVTGSSGFVGSTLCPMLAQAGYTVRAALRADKPTPVSAAERVVVGEIGRHTDWTRALSGIDLIVHLAATVHVPDDRATAESHVETNARGTQQLAIEAARHGIRRLVYLSTVKVNGEETANQPFSAADVPQPADTYASSKWHGEQLLANVCARAALEAVVVRSPLVYGPGVGANFLRLLNLVDRERLLPLGAIRNRRSLVSVWNLCDLLLRVLEHPAAAGGTWMVSDGTDISTPNLARFLAGAMGRRARLVSIPGPLLVLGAELVGKGGEMRKLCGSLAVDIVSTRQLLGWAPPLSMDEALVRTVRWYQSHGRASS